MASDPNDRADARLLELAAQLLGELGADGLTMDALAARAGLSRATLYRRLGSRARLLERLRARGDLAAADPARRDLPTRVLEAMQRVLARDGFSGATVERVAQEAGVGTATVYRRFGDREGLFAAYARQFSPRSAARGLADSGVDLEPGLLGLARESLDFFRRHPELVRLRLSGDPEALRLLGGDADGQERMLPTLARYFEPAIAAGRLAPADPLVLATAFGGLVTGFALMSQDRSGPGLSDLDAAARTLVDIFLHGARSRPATRPLDDGGDRT